MEDDAGFGRFGSEIEQTEIGPPDAAFDPFATRCSGDVAIRVEPDGTVVPPRGPRRASGNLLHDPWDQIWDAPAFRVYREQLDHATRCDQCADLAQCAVVCPRDPAGWTHEDGEVER